MGHEVCCPGDGLDPQTTPLGSIPARRIAYTAPREEPDSGAPAQRNSAGSTTALFEEHGRIPPAEFEANYYRQTVSATKAETQTHEPA
jgi:hypothetical protein